MSLAPVAPRAAALERARAFAARHGSPLDRLRLEALADASAAPAARAALEALQRADGAFPPLPGRPAQGPVASTHAGLRALLELRVRRARSLERAVRWLAAAQAGDGSWGDEPAAAPGARVAPTGFVGGGLACTPYARPEVLAAAGDFLDARWSPARVEGGAWDELAALCAFFSNVAHDRADEVLQRCGRELERGFRTGAFDGVRTARVLTLCDAVGIPGARLDPGELVKAILAGQRDDGGWAPRGDDSAPGRVAATLDAALALARLPS